MPRTPRRFSRPLLVALLLAGVAAVTTVVKWITADRSGPWDELARANSHLKVAASVAGRVLVSDRNGADQV